MADCIRSREFGAVLITGTAGDGKTYHCRQLWSRLEGDPSDWDNSNPIKHLRLADGRSACFVKDLSELSDSIGERILDGLEAAVSGQDEQTVYVIAANHGQILDRLRRRAHQQNSSSPLYQPIQEALIHAGKEHTRLKVFDLSRTAHRQSLDNVMRAVTEHQQWSKCQSCDLDQGDRICPIAENRRRLLRTGDEGAERLNRRLGDLIEVARLNGAHLPVRDLLALAANMLLGHPDAKEGLMTCNDVQDLQGEGRIGFASLYSNVFAENLKSRKGANRAMSRSVFRILHSFGIGTETNNNIDGLLVYGTDDTWLRQDFETLVANDTIYGASSNFEAFQHQYLEGEEGARLDADAFLARLGGQRQRLFFTLPEEVADRYMFWELTTFRYAGDYLELVDAIRPDGDRRPLDERVRERIVQGLNRGMTGLLLDNADQIFIASSGGFTQSKLSVLCENTLPSRYDRERGLGLIIRWDSYTQSPCLSFRLSRDRSQEINFDLTPVRFEFLCRVAEGALPSSFSNECFEDLLALKARLLSLSEDLRRQSQLQDDEEEYVEPAGLELTFIEIEEKGHGFLKKITVRSSV